MALKKIIILFCAFSLIFANNIAPDNRILNGVETLITEIPYQVSLWNGTMHKCGGVLITFEWILTAGHCLTGKFPGEKYQIRVNSSDSHSGGYLFDVIREYVHPKLNDILDYDVALLRIKEIDDQLKEHLNTPHWPGCHTSKCISGDFVQISGWGVNLIGNLEKSRKLQSVRVPMADFDVCRSMYIEPVTDRMFCAGNIEQQQDACIGDSGGPVTCRGNLIGLVSSGGDCFSLIDSYGVYTNLMNYEIQEWIEKITEIEMPCKAIAENNPQNYNFNGK